MDLDEMPGYCAVRMCRTNPVKDKKKLFRVPVVNSRFEEISRARQKMWLEALGINDADENRMKHLRVCEDHFVSGKSADLFNRDDPDWIPTVNMKKTPDSCCVRWCMTYPPEDRKSMFHFPKVTSQYEELSKNRQERWLKALGINSVDEDRIKSLRVCQDHFISGRSADFFDTNNPDWIPTHLNETSGAEPGLDPSQDNNNVSLFEIEYCNVSDVNEIESQGEFALDWLTYDYCSTLFEEEVANEVATNENVGVIGSVATEAEISETHLSVAAATMPDNDLEGLHKLLLTYKERIRILEEMFLEQTIRLDSFKDDDKKTNFFTGLTTFKTMKAVFLKLEEFLPECKEKLSKFQVFYIVLTRLRLNFSFRYLSYKLSVSEQTISKYFHKGLYVMYSKLRSLVYWPGRESIKKTMPESFRRCFGDTITVIIDCFEIFVQKSTLMKAQSQTWSTYKHANTIKYLIGITPQGLISFVSVGYGGRASDKFITEKSGFLEMIEDGDVVMADRGFLVENALKDIGARAEIPAFTKGKSQLNPYEIEATRNIANVRIHVEREIGLLRLKYTILAQRQFPLHFVRRSTCAVSVIDQIVVLCAALINLCQPICVRLADD